MRLDLIDYKNPLQYLGLHWTSLGFNPARIRLQEDLEGEHEEEEEPGGHKSANG